MVNQLEIAIRFYEVDAMGIVWHGHYLKYFELGREALAQQHGFNYMTVQKQGYFTPVIKSVCEHKSSLKYGDVALIETTFKISQAAKLVFNYKIYRKSDLKLCATGETIQVFTNLAGELQIINPPFFETWKNSVT